MFKKIIFIGLTLLLSSCTIREAQYVNSDNYNKYYYYFFGNIEVNKNKYKLSNIFDENNSYQDIINKISIIDDHDWKNNSVYIIVLYSTVNAKNYNFNDVYSKLNKIYAYLTNQKQFKNKFYVIGVPDISIKKYKAFLYLSRV